MQLFSSLAGNWRGRPAAEQAPVPPAAAAEAAPHTLLPLAGPADAAELIIAPGDPLLVWLAQSGAPADVDTLRLDSPALAQMRAAGVKLVVPLVNQGELLGIIRVGARRSDQEYSSEDRRLLAELASRAAPSVRVAQLVRQQEQEAADREWIAAELRVARTIQETLLPKQVPDLAGFAISAYWQPARMVGGDFYDFIQFDDGTLALIVGDVTDKGVPAALVMSTTRTVLRSVAERLRAPGAVLQRANQILCPDIPPRMFITCLFAVLNPATGLLRFANAGHDLPYLRSADNPGNTESVRALRATGMPLGLLPDMEYEENEVTLQPGDTVLFYSDGLVEAHNPAREMFSFRRLRERVGRHPGGAALIPWLLNELQEFVGAGWEQEDDVTLVTLQRLAVAQAAADATGAPDARSARSEGHATPALLAAFSLASQAGNERDAMARVGAAVAACGLPAGQVLRLQTAVAEATMNAMEHGNLYQPELLVHLRVEQSDDAITVTVTDHGGGRPISPSVTPNLEAKLAGEQSPRGWGLFLIRNMVDQMETHVDEHHHTIELTMKLPKDSAEPEQAERTP